MHLLNVQALLVFSKKPTVNLGKTNLIEIMLRVTDEIWFFFDVETKDIQKWDYRFKIIKRPALFAKKAWH